MLSWKEDIPAFTPQLKKSFTRNFVWDELGISIRYKFELWTAGDYTYRIICTKTQEQWEDKHITYQFTFNTDNLKYAKKCLDDFARIIAPRKCMTSARFIHPAPPRSQILSPQ